MLGKRFACLGDLLCRQRLMTGRADGFRELLSINRTPACAVIIQAGFAVRDVLLFMVNGSLQAINVLLAFGKRTAQLVGLVLDRHALAGKMGVVFGFQLTELILQCAQLVACLCGKGVVRELHQLALHPLALGLQTVAFAVRRREIKAFELRHHAAALVHANRQGVEVCVHVLALLHQHGPVFIHCPAADFLGQLSKLRCSRKQLLVLRQTADLSEQRAAVFPVHSFRYRPDIGEQLKLSLVDQLCNAALVCVFGKRHIVDVIVTGVTGVALDGRTARLLPLLAEHLAELDRLTVHLGHRACRCTSRLDGRAAVACAVLVEKQPRQRIINAGFACGIGTEQAVHALVKVEVQLGKTLEVHQVQRFQFNFH